MKKGQVVRVKAYGGEVLTRRVVAIRATVVEVCNEETYQTAITEGHEPQGIGFLHEDVMEVKDS